MRLHQPTATSCCRVLLLLISSFCCESLVAANRAGLVAAYAFDEGQGTTVFDFSGNGNGGLVSNPNWTVGRYGGALLFNGTDALVTVAHSPPLNLGSGMTLEAWVNPARLSTDWADVIYKANDAYYLEASSAAGPPAVGGRSLATPLLAPNVLPAGIWSHLAATYDGITLRLYLNGTQVASRSQSGTIESSTEPLTIGGDNIYGQFFQGVIDEVRIWNVARSAADIQLQMTAPVASAAGLIGRWSLDEGLGTAVVDSTGNGNTGTLLNGPGWIAGTPTLAKLNWSER